MTSASRDWWVPKPRTRAVSDELLASLSVPVWMIPYLPSDYMSALAIRIGCQLVQHPFPMAKDVEEILEYDFSIRPYEMIELTARMDEEGAGSEIVMRIGEGAILAMVDPTEESEREPEIYPGAIELLPMLAALSTLLG